MSLKYVCPLPASIVALTPLTCAEHFGQITRLAFQRTGTNFPDSAGAALDIDLLASWTALIAAGDATTIQIAPIHDSFILPVGEPVEEGGDDNTTPFGQSLILGAGQVSPTGRYRGLPAAQKLEMDQFVSESAVFGSLGVYLFNEHGQIISNNITGTEEGPFPITAYFLSSVGSEGFNTHNFNNFKWSFLSGWADKFNIIDPVDFDPNVDF